MSSTECSLRFHEVTKKSSADGIASSTTETLYTLKLKQEEESDSDNPPEGEKNDAEYQIIVYTSSIQLTLHAPSKHSSPGDEVTRPTNEEQDTVAGFDTGYTGVILRSVDEENDETPSENDTLTAVLMEMDVPVDMPDELKEMVKVSLLFKTSSDQQIRVFDEDEVVIALNELSTPKSLSDPGGDKHLSKLIEEGEATRG